MQASYYASGIASGWQDGIRDALLAYLEDGWDVKGVVTTVASGTTNNNYVFAVSPKTGRTDPTGSGNEAN